MTTETNWLTPETAIGATLPCGARVVRSRPYVDDNGDILDTPVIVHFDSPPIDDTGFQSRMRGPWYFKTDGTGDCFPPLTPAGPVTHESILASIKAASTPQPITHAAILAAVELLQCEQPHLSGPAEYADALCAQLGVEVPVKRAPWEAAYKAWQAARNSPGGAEPDYSVKGTWQAAWAACEAHHGIGGADQ